MQMVFHPGSLFLLMWMVGHPESLAEQFKHISWNLLLMRMVSHLESLAEHFKHSSWNLLLMQMVSHPGHGTKIMRGRRYFLVIWVNSEMYYSLLTGVRRCQSIGCIIDGPRLMPWDNSHGTRNARGVPLQVYINVYVCILTSKSISPVFYWTGPCWIYICIVVLCTSRCVVFYNVPPLMGQILGKVLLTSWERY